MSFLLKALGLGLLMGGIYVLAQDIIFTSHVNSGWWNGIAADGSVLALMGGVLLLVFLPRRDKHLGWILVTVGIVLVFLSSRAILNSVSLWQFLLSFTLIAGGYNLMRTGRLPL